MQARYKDKRQSSASACISLVFAQQSFITFNVYLAIQDDLWLNRRPHGNIMSSRRILPEFGPEILETAIKRGKAALPDDGSEGSPPVDQVPKPVCQPRDRPRTRLNI
jgi:hypothetical protein